MQPNSYIPMPMTTLLNIIITIICDERMTMSIILLLITGLDSGLSSCPESALQLLSCLVGILANTPGGVKRSGLGAHAVGFLVVY